MGWARCSFLLKLRAWEATFITGPPTSPGLTVTV